MSDLFVKFTGRINRRTPVGERDPSEPVERENWLCRDGVLSKPPGHESIVDDLPNVPRWMGRYYPVDPTEIAPKTFVYTEDGQISYIDSSGQASDVCKTLIKQNAFPKHTLFKTGTQNKLYFVDGEYLYSHDGNEENQFDLVDLEDADGNSVEPIDLIEHKDRLLVISNTSLFISKRLYPEIFDDPTDSLEVIVGSGRGTNLALGKIEDRVYILNTEGIFVLEGDVISALATTFEVRLVDERKIISGRTAVTVEKAIVFLADDFELWSWDGYETKMLTYELKLKDYVNKNRDMLDKATAVYHDNYYKMSFVETGSFEPDLEIWWDAVENIVALVRGRHVSCYLKIDPTIEEEYMEMGQSNEAKIVRDDRGYDFDGSAIITRLRSADIVIKKGYTVRFLAFYPSFKPTGNRNIIIRYLLDGRLAIPTGGTDTYWTQNLRGEVKTYGGISITNQNQATDRIRPLINYAKGESIAFEIVEETAGLRADLLGIGIDYLVKHKSKSATIGA